MTEFLNLTPPDEALAILLYRLDVDPVPQEIDTELSLGRVTVSPVLAPHPLPEFRRSTVDGYAVRAADTFGAGESLPSYLNLIGEVHMGKSTDLVLEPTQCALIHTGGMLPEGADAVVMIEHTQSSRPGYTASRSTPRGPTGRSGTRSAWTRSIRCLPTQRPRASRRRRPAKRPL